jgi:hypothetical protein
MCRNATRNPVRSKYQQNKGNAYYGQNLEHGVILIRVQAL